MQAQQRPDSWFKEPPVELDRLLASWRDCTREGPHNTFGLLPLESLAEAGSACWRQADNYYFRNMARMQRLWECALTPHKDLALQEVFAAAINIFPWNTCTTHFISTGPLQLVGC